MLSDLQKALIAAALLLYGSLYLSFVAVAGLITHNPFAWKLALLSMGMAFLSFVGQYLSGVSARYGDWAKGATWASIIAAVLGGSALLWRL